MWTVFPCANHPCGQLPLIFWILSDSIQDAGTPPRIKWTPNLQHRRHHPSLAEYGGYAHQKWEPNLHHRRPNKPLADDGGYRPAKWTPNLHLRRPHPPLAENGSSAHQKWKSNLHHRRQIKKSPKTDVTDPQNRVLTSVFGDSSTSQAVRITRPLHAAPT